MVEMEAKFTNYKIIQFALTAADNSYLPPVLLSMWLFWHIFAYVFHYNFNEQYMQKSLSDRFLIHIFSRYLWIQDNSHYNVCIDNNI